MASSGKNTRGNSSFPPNPSQWSAERNAISFRAHFGVHSNAPLRPFSLTLPNVTLLATIDELRGIVDEVLLKSLFGEHRDKWSGMTIPCGDSFVVIMNETHARTRQNATLMEEYFHIVLKHKASRVGVCPKTGLARREYDKSLEVEAYHSAAAALIPYAAMREMVRGGASRSAIARHFEVSDDLAAFRLKTCKLYRRAS